MTELVEVELREILMKLQNGLNDWCGCMLHGNAVKTGASI